MTNYLPRASLQVGAELVSFAENEALVAADVEPEVFWSKLDELVTTFGPRNRELIEVRSSMQSAIDRWHQEHRWPIDIDSYRAMLEEIGYIVTNGPDFAIRTKNVDAELSSIAGPQLVVPITNARYALNAANARWTSLYDALYGTDALGSEPPEGPYSVERGAEVIAWTRAFLDDVLPLDSGSHAEVQSYEVVDGHLHLATSGGSARLVSPDAFVGYVGQPSAPEAILLRNNGLHIELNIDRSGRIGSTDSAGINDVIVESAISAIVDCEDSVATVDAQDKALAYSNWLGLMRGDLTEQVNKEGSSFVRRLNDDRHYQGASGGKVTLSGRATLLIRNVGHLMTTPAVLDQNGNEAYEGLIDAMFTTLCAMPDLQRQGGNSKSGSIYVVKPKMHGPDEVSFADSIFDFVEDALGLTPHTVKLGVMDEERRTTVNLAECLRAADQRVVFINTGFLDRTGDEFHTSMQAGPFVPKTQMKSQGWIQAYEKWNVDIGLQCGLQGRAQIGKGMWAAPNRMAAMLTEKIDHPNAGANCAWVPSPTAATLHATHYHRVDVAARQDALVKQGARASLNELLAIPVAEQSSLTEAEVQAELDNNAQGILGYVVRWVDQGIGCSTVPDIHGIGLMEDRATCRISAQHMANWLHHGIVSPEQTEQTLRRMAEVVDQQNAEDPEYRPMAPNFDGHAFLAARDLVFSGVEQPSGYTEPILHSRRLRAKSQL